jgi:hypothetical protein
MGARVENPESLVGVWSRRSIEWPDGRRDETTRVWWLQAQPHFGDIRIPADRPSFSGVRSLNDCDDDRRAWLARQEGFAGTLAADDAAWLWNRSIDYQPPTGRRDIGRLIFTDEHNRTMIEQGVDEPYTEIWVRIDDASSTRGQTFVMRGNGEAGLLIAVGEHFLLAVDDRKTGVEISHGMRRGPISDWIVTESTLPWRERTRLFANVKPALQWNERKLVEARSWEIVEPSSGRLDWIY